MFVFSPIATDNGAPSNLPASNWPYRGSKGSYFEGGVHAVGFIHSPLLPKSTRGTISNTFMHVSDWYPTIVQGIAGERVTKPLDGFNLWKRVM